MTKDDLLYTVGYLSPAERTIESVIERLESEPCWVCNSKRKGHHYVDCLIPDLRYARDRVKQVRVALDEYFGEDADDN